MIFQKKHHLDNSYGKRLNIKHIVLEIIVVEKIVELSIVRYQKNKNKVKNLPLQTLAIKLQKILNKIILFLITKNQDK